MIIIVLLIISPIIWFIYASITRHYDLINNLKRNGFNVVPCLPLIGNNIVLSSPFSYQLFGELSQTYGKTYALLRGSVPTVITSDPTVIREICITNFGSFHSHALDPLDSDIYDRRNVHLFHARGSKWKRLRTVMSSAFSLHAMRTWFPKMVHRTEIFIDNLPTGVIVPLHSILQKHTSSVIASCSFDGCDETEWDGVVQFFGSEASLTISVIANALPYLAPMVRSIDRWRSRADHPLAIFTKFIAKKAQLRERDEAPTDFLQYLKRVEVDEVDNMDEGRESFFDPSTTKMSKQITVDELPAQLRFVSIAGFDTTANTLTFLILLLAEHPHIQDHLRSLVAHIPSEIDSVSDLPYLQACISETLRLYPHASTLHTRECTSPLTLSSGLHFERGTQILVDTWSLHRDPSIWGDDVMEFKPQRFLDSPSLFSIPFGVGPRQCIGMRFALLEIKLAIIQLLQRYRIQRVPESTMRLTVRDSNTIWPSGILVQFEPLSID